MEGMSAYIFAAALLGYMAFVCIAGLICKWLMKVD